MISFAIGGGIHRFALAMYIFETGKSASVNLSGIGQVKFNSFYTGNITQAALQTKHINNLKKIIKHKNELVNI